MNSKLIIACTLGLLMSQVQAGSETDQRLERMERRVSHLTELMLEVEGLKRENRRLQGRVEELQHVVGNLQRKQREMYQDVDERLTSLQSGRPVADRLPAESIPDNGQPGRPVTPARDSTPETTESRIPPGDPAREEAAYAAAYDLLRPEQRRYPEAIQAFEVFIQQYPDGKYTDNARYWLGEANYVIQDNAAALAAFQQVLSLHPGSPKAPGALLKIGYIHDAMGDAAAARKSLQRVIDDYPASSAAGMARKRLDNMRRKAN